MGGTPSAPPERAASAKARGFVAAAIFALMPLVGIAQVKEEERFFFNMLEPVCYVGLRSPGWMPEGQRAFAAEAAENHRPLVFERPTWALDTITEWGPAPESYFLRPDRFRTLVKRQLLNVISPERLCEYGGSCTVLILDADWGEGLVTGQESRVPVSSLLSAACDGECPVLKKASQVIWVGVSPFSKKPEWQQDPERLERELIKKGRTPEVAHEVAWANTGPRAEAGARNWLRAFEGVGEVIALDDLSPGDGQQLWPKLFDYMKSWPYSDHLERVAALAGFGQADELQEQLRQSYEALYLDQVKRRELEANTNRIFAAKASARKKLLSGSAEEDRAAAQEAEKKIKQYQAQLGSSADPYDRSYISQLLAQALRQKGKIEERQRARASAEKSQAGTESGEGYRVPLPPVSLKEMSTSQFAQFIHNPDHWEYSPSSDMGEKFRGNGISACSAVNAIDEDRSQKRFCERAANADASVIERLLAGNFHENEPLLEAWLAKSGHAIDLSRSAAVKKAFFAAIDDPKLSAISRIKNLGLAYRSGVVPEQEFQPLWEKILLERVASYFESKEEDKAEKLGGLCGLSSFLRSPLALGVQPALRVPLSHVPQKNASDSDYAKVLECLPLQDDQHRLQNLALSPEKKVRKMAYAVIAGGGLEDVDEAIARKIRLQMYQDAKDAGFSMNSDDFGSVFREVFQLKGSDAEKSAEMEANWPALPLPVKKSVLQQWNGASNPVFTKALVRLGLENRETYSTALAFLWISGDAVWAAFVPRAIEILNKRVDRLARESFPQPKNPRQVRMELADAVRLVAIAAAAKGDRTLVDQAAMKLALVGTQTNDFSIFPDYVIGSLMIEMGWINSAKEFTEWSKRAQGLLRFADKVARALPADFSVSRGSGKIPGEDAFYAELHVKSTLVAASLLESQSEMDPALFEWLMSPRQAAVEGDPLVTEDRQKITSLLARKSIERPESKPAFERLFSRISNPALRKKLKARFDEESKAKP